MNARCQCGLIRFTTPTPSPLKIYICHCLECQRQSSSTYGVSLMFDTFELPATTVANLHTYTRTTFTGKQKNCVFCKDCGSRIYHHCPGQPLMTLKLCVEGVTREMMDGAVHIWTKRAITTIPDGVERWEEEPDDGTGDKL